MFAKTAEDVTGKFAGGLFDRLFTPAAFFWLTFAASWTLAGGAARLRSLPDDLAKFSDVKLLLLTGAALALVVFSDAAYEPLQDWTMRRLSGYWGPLDALGTIPRTMLRVRYRRYDRLWRRLVKAKKHRALTAPEQRSLADAERRTHYLPSQAEDAMPTVFGCALVAAGRRIEAKYGLSWQFCWPALSHVLAESAKKDVTDALAAVQASARLLFFSLAALVWTLLSPIAWLALPVAAFTYVRIQEQGRDYADALEAAYDTGRPALYEALRFALPANAGQERAAGQLVTNYLRNGSDDPRLTFVGKADSDHR